MNGNTSEVPEEADAFFISFVSLPLKDDELFLRYLWRKEGALGGFLDRMKSGTYGSQLNSIRLEFFVEGIEGGVPMGVDSLKGQKIRHVSYIRASGISNVAIWVPRSDVEVQPRLSLARKVIEATSLVIEGSRKRLAVGDSKRILSDLSSVIGEYAEMHSFDNPTGQVSDK